MLNEEELRNINNIESKEYMRPVLNKLNEYCEKINNYTEVFDKLYNIITESKEDVDLTILERINRGEIKDKNQASKSIVGNMFQYLLIYVFLKAKEKGVIEKENIYISSKKIKVPGLDELYTIKVGDDIQKPDCDIVIYKLDNNNQLESCLILSLKTSLRERAGQTYKWKLLMEIAMDNDNKVKKKYELEYNPRIKPYVAFATVNFYNEINNPQQRGMFKFFDKTFIARKIEDHSFISPLSSIVDFLNKDF